MNACKWRANGNGSAWYDVLLISQKFSRHQMMLKWIWMNFHFCAYPSMQSTLSMHMNHCFINTPPASKQPTDLFALWLPSTFTDILISYCDHQCWVIDEMFKLEKQRSVSLSFSILISHQTVENWLCQVSDCEDWPVDKQECRLGEHWHWL